MDDFIIFSAVLLMSGGVVTRLLLGGVLFHSVKRDWCSRALQGLVHSWKTKSCVFVIFVHDFVLGKEKFL